MRDPRIDTLARMLVRYSIEAKRGDRVLIQAGGPARELVQALVREVYAADALPFVGLNDRAIEREILLGATEEQLSVWAHYDVERMKQMDCYIGFSASENLSSWADVPADKLELYQKIYNKQVHMGERLNNTRWVVLRSPTPAFAQLAGMSEEAFDEFFYKVCTLDYEKMSRAMDALAAVMAKADRVRIVSPGTDLSFSIKGMPQIKCDGKLNVPDGEVYTAPLRESVNGKISYNTASLYAGFVFENISFEFKDGKIIRAEANDSERLNKILDTDEGARYIGEFSFGLNPHILTPMKDTLFDEKITGSIHFTPGNAYENCDNGNRSAVHWDLVLIQREDYGGGEIYLDDVLIRKNGRFVLSELECLNPEHLA